jgi:hypothetical protein
MKSSPPALGKHRRMFFSCRMPSMQAATSIECCSIGWEIEHLVLGAEGRLAPEDVRLAAVAGNRHGESVVPARILGRHDAQDRSRATDRFAGVNVPGGCPSGMSAGR